MFMASFENLDGNSLLVLLLKQDTGRPLPKFGDWDVNDPASAEGFTVIFNKARDEKKTVGKPESPVKVDPHIKPAVDPGKPQVINSLILTSHHINGLYLCNST
ncbi:hypothetical protein GH714_022922 [Hevea brasiliensis]|uniref:RIN4 pathogenic type III effector avirulence factor Avr cleavage site domain-containing protein n=1 Tax=Hevea brasiliensis TaxID=3981 RepID=A0A6A6KNB6_HEVBR|nr:hypothetical protein GH714_022922 [Hevea brasiliensis]